MFDSQIDGWKVIFEKNLFTTMTIHCSDDETFKQDRSHSKASNLLVVMMLHIIGATTSDPTFPLISILTAFPI